MFTDEAVIRWNENIVNYLQDGHDNNDHPVTQMMLEQWPEAHFP